jgi:hypothetical protein
LTKARSSDASGRLIPGFSAQIGGISDHGFGVSMAVERAIDFELPDHEGKAWRLADHLARGPVLLVFYRGDW